MSKVFEFQGVEYLLGTAGSLILACPKCGREHFREPENYFWSLVPENKARIEQGQKTIGAILRGTFAWYAIRIWSRYESMSLKPDGSLFGEALIIQLPTITA